MQRFAKFKKILREGFRATLNFQKQNVYEIDSFNKFNFCQSQEILHTLIDV